MKAIEFIENYFGAKIPDDWDRNYQPLQNFSIKQLEEMLVKYAAVRCRELRDKLVK